MREPLQERSRDSADRVLETALRIMRTDGLSAVTTARLAAESGVSNGSIYHRFRNRRTLLSHALDLFVAQVEAQIEQLRGALVEDPGDLAARVALVVQVYRGVFDEHGPLIRAFFVDALTDPDLAERGEQAKSLFADGVAGFLSPRLHEISAPDHAFAFRMIHRLLFGHFVMRMLFHEGATEEAAVEALGAAVLGVLNPPGGR